MQQFLRVLIILYLRVATIRITSTLTSTTSAFFLRSKLPVSYYISSTGSSSSRSNIPFTSSVTKPTGLHSLSKPTYFNYKQQQQQQCNAENQHSRTRCYLTLSSKNIESVSGDTGDTNRKEVEKYEQTNDDRKSDFFVYYTVLFDEQRSRVLTKVSVKPGDEIDDIRKEIKKDNSNIFASVDAVQLEIFASDEQEEPLNALKTWNSSVTWGTKLQPLIVKVNPLMVAGNSVAAVGVTKSPWIDCEAQYSEEINIGRLFIDSIMKPYEGIPNSGGMKCLFDVASIEGIGASQVVLRNITEDFWWKVIEATETHRVCALGTPGVGKTTSTCILMRLLLELKKTVVYRVRRIDKGGFVYMFTPTLGVSGSRKVDVKGIPEFEFNYRDREINKPSTYYIVDPGRTKDNCNLDENFYGQVIIVASPDERHWGGTDFDKGRGGIKNKRGKYMYFPVWTLPELIASSSYFDLHVPQDEIRHRFCRFGGVPRIIFSSSGDYILYKESQHRALEGLTVASAISLAYKTRSAIKTQSEDLPRGTLLSYTLADDDNGTYTKSYAIFSSDFVYEFIVERYMYELWDRIVPNEGYFDPYLFKTYCTKLFYDKVQPSKVAFTVRDSETPPSNAKNSNMTLVQCKQKEKVENIIDSARRVEHCLFTPVSKTNKLIDFMYRDGNTYYAFQSTIAERHDASPKLIYEFVMDVLKEFEVEATYLMPKIIIFYTIPMFRYDIFNTKPAKANTKAREYCKTKIGKNANFYLKWNNVVTIHFLRVDAPKESRTSP